ncbi:MAG: acetyltransferase [Bdellovibrionales bacterium]|nr:acetyltransferase [Bdellovibrionales bacterium]
MKDNEPILIFGCGGHAKVVWDILNIRGYKNFIFVDKDPTTESQFLGHSRLGLNDALQISKRGIVAIGDNYTRKIIVTNTIKICPDFIFISAIHPTATIGLHTTIESGTVVMANTAINCFCKIGSHTIINTGSTVDHECNIDDFSSLAPGCTLGGSVHIEQLSAVGLGANIIHNVTVGENSVVGAGSTVINDINSNQLAFGTPCVEVRTRRIGEKYL